MDHPREADIADEEAATPQQPWVLPAQNALADVARRLRRVRHRHSSPGCSIPTALRCRAWRAKALPRSAK
jgi:hypothetical protein